jgi:hypothetical protein
MWLYVVYFCMINHALLKMQDFLSSFPEMSIVGGSYGCGGMSDAVVV